MTSEPSFRFRIVLEGIVQGVGFRPFVKRLADSLQLPGITFNTASGLIIELDCDGREDAERFVKCIHKQAPAAARIERCVVEQIAGGSGYQTFEIVASAARDAHFTLTSPDLAMCKECAAEIADPSERRFQYAFTNCTNCGPRYSITISTPYDRANTTMRRFEMCAECQAEYTNPANRRFHAEPIACPICGPRLSMELAQAIAALEGGQILGVKGLGGFQLACDAFSAPAVDEMRVRKRRSRKPFAVMMRDLSTVDRLCLVSRAEQALLLSAAAPIVLLQMRDEAEFAAGVAPGLRQIGVMLPYTPLHQLLFQGSVTCMVMTSGNVSEEPIVITNQEAKEKLAALCDEMVMHDRDIFMRVDDSVARIFENAPRVLRRARGYAPGAISLGREMGEVLATGAELKNTFCITKGKYAILSQHIGDLENHETLSFFEETWQNLQSVYQAKPAVIAHDLHPDYLSTRWALARPEPKIRVQHHHAHVASCMAENHVNERLIGVAFDGTGLGTDGQIWGGEFLVCDFLGFKRRAHLKYVALPGGDKAAREGWRMAAAHLHDAIGPKFRSLDLPSWGMASAQNWKVLDRMLAKPAVRTSSCGRLFDAVSAICGIAQQSSYEGEAAMLLEAAAQCDTDEEYLIELDLSGNPWIIDSSGMMRQIAAEAAAGRSPQQIGRCFHNSLARVVEMVCLRVRETDRLEKVCLSGGAFQNFTLLGQASRLLRSAGFQVLLHSQVPPNDGGLSLGQAAIAAALSSTA